MKPKPLVELNHLTVPVVMMNPFIAILKNRDAKTSRMMITIFERKVRSGRGAKRAVTKAQQANIDKRTLASLIAIVNF
jgi:hypothetical protein